MNSDSGNNKQVVLQLKLNRRLMTLVAFLLAGALAVVGIGAVSAQSAETINGCVSKKDGSFRVVQSVSSCDTKKETPVSWNQKGPKGNTGATGAAGPKGETGPQGLQGETGAMGPAGSQGEQGEQGLDGTNGTNGVDGKTVLNGEGEPEEPQRRRYR